ncbi:hypothetical protein GF402_03910 [Candidatus Fermentibacteria bacterium]|nr:hypothetical protein [Candidatus Fermentibacteria bacterium]
MEALLPPAGGAAVDRRQKNREPGSRLHGPGQAGSGVVQAGAGEDLHGRRGLGPHLPALRSWPLHRARAQLPGLRRRKVRRIPDRSTKGLSKAAGRRKGLAPPETYTLIDADDPQSRETLSEYISRAPFSLERMTFAKGSDTVLFRGEHFHLGLGRNFEVTDPLEWIARITSHIPRKGAKQVIYYGAYSQASPTATRAGLRAGRRLRSLAG